MQLFPIAGRGARELHSHTLVPGFSITAIAQLVYSVSSLFSCSEKRCKVKDIAQIVASGVLIESKGLLACCLTLFLLPAEEQKNLHSSNLGNRFLYRIERPACMQCDLFSTASRGAKRKHISHLGVRCCSNINKPTCLHHYLSHCRMKSKGTCVARHLASWVFCSIKWHAHVETCAAQHLASCFSVASNGLLTCSVTFSLLPVEEQRELWPATAEPCRPLTCIQLKFRHWIIRHADGDILQEVKGGGVIGEYPILRPGMSPFAQLILHTLCIVCSHLDRVKRCYNTALMMYLGQPSISCPVT